MRRTLLIFLMVFLAGASLSFATVTRTKTMGRVGHWVRDDSNVFPWPSTVVDFSDRFILELGEGAFSGGYNPVHVGPSFPVGFGGGTLFGLDETHHIGLFVEANDRANGGGVTDVFFPDGLSIDDFLTLFYGFNGGGNTDFGLNFNIGSSTNEQTAPENAVSKQSVGRMGIQGGITHQLSVDRSIDIAVGFQTTSLTDEGVDGIGNTVTNLESDGYNTLSARARMFWGYSENVELVPFLEYRRENKGVKEDRNDDGRNDEVKEKNTIFNAAIGANYAPHERVHIILVGGVLIARSESTIEGDVSGERDLNHFPYVKGGIEAGIRDWIDVRAGVEKQMIQEDAIPFTTYNKSVRSQYQGYVGAGLHFAGWTLDMQINPDIIFDGPNFISGDANTMNHRVSLVRPW